VDILMSLRTQTERHNSSVYASLKDYAKDFCITSDLIQDRDLIVMHPGPVHRNIDISDEVINDSRSKILDQVKNGVVVRMAILNFFLAN
jgi:aspartate carbamoyltransferase catalytic subunit